MGGRPSREITTDPDLYPTSGLEEDEDHRIRNYWYSESERHRHEIDRWLDFRWDQYTLRKDPKTFNRLGKSALKYLRDKGMDWSVEFKLDRQTKLDEWKEYYIFELGDRPALERKVERAEQEMKRVSELCNQKMEKARQEVEVLQKSLEALKADESLEASKKADLISRAEKDLDLMQKRLEAETSDDLERLGKEFERNGRRPYLQGRVEDVAHAKRCLQRLDTLLEWIAAQFPEMCTVYTPSSQESQHDRDLLAGWEGYYTLMREKLQRVRESQAYEQQSSFWSSGAMWSESEQAEMERKYPMDHEKTLTTLLKWIEQEFPETVEDDAPLNQSDGNYQNQALLYCIRS